MPTINGTNRPDSLGNLSSILPYLINGLDGNDTIRGGNPTPKRSLLEVGFLS
ncbi:MAG: hypothetical protein V7L31_23510 [Nostoc sp.]|uniref:hypothetical protein n=1 Tax=Nostoc sp. TaxID=1180 RepID=UPI002FF3DF8C